MNDILILENYLLILKSNVEVYVHGTLESSYNDTRKLLNKCLNKTLDMQENTFKYLVNLNAYDIKNTDKNKINKVIKSNIK